MEFLFGFINYKDKNVKTAKSQDRYFILMFIDTYVCFACWCRSLLSIFEYRLGDRKLTNMYLMERGCKNSPKFFFFEIVNDAFLIFSNISLINVFLKTLCYSKLHNGILTCKLSNVVNAYKVCSWMLPRTCLLAKLSFVLDILVLILMIA